MINIIYEDNHLLVVEKPINIPVQKDNSNDEDLLSILKQYLKDKYHKPGNVYLGLVHRLDRPVGGVMVFAKTSKCASRLSEQVRNREFSKTYFAICEGKVSKSGTFKDKLLKNHHTNTVSVSKNGKEAILDYELINYKNNLSLVKINLKTGRSHQIRVQFAYHGYPLYGDHRYNASVEESSQIALFAKSLSFKHPTTHKSLTFELELPTRYPWNIFS